MYECFHCGMRTVIWQSDFTFEEMGYGGEGVVNCCKCTNCGADIEYRVADKQEDESDGSGEELDNS